MIVSFEGIRPGFSKFQVPERQNVMCSDLEWHLFNSSSYGGEPPVSTRVNALTSFVPSFHTRAPAKLIYEVVPHGEYICRLLAHYDV